MGQFLGDPPSALNGFPARRHGAILSAASQHAFGLAEKPDDPAHSADVLPGSRQSGPGRGNAGYDGRAGRGVRPDDQFVGPARARARALGPPPRHRAGRLVYARALHRRRADAGGMPAPISSKATEDQGLGAQHWPSRLFTRAGILHAARVRQAVPSAVRRAQSLRQRLRRRLRGRRRQGRLAGRQVLAGSDRSVLPRPGHSGPHDSSSAGEPDQRPAVRRQLPRTGLEHPGILRHRISRPDRELRQRAPGARARGNARREPSPDKPAVQRRDRRWPLLGNRLGIVGRGGGPAPGAPARESSPGQTLVTWNAAWPGNPSTGEPRRAATTFSGCRAGCLARPAIARPAQRCFGFLERSQRLARRFKAAILLGTSLVVIVTLTSSSSGRYLAGWLATRSRWAVLHGIGIPPGRDEIDADWRRRRLHDIEQTRGKLRSTYAEYDPAMRKLLDYAGLDPDHALLRWGNFDRTLYLPSTVLESDDKGRSYRFRPGVRSIWVRNLRLKGGILAYFPILLGPDLDQAVQGTGAEMIQSSVQTTNSWGLRGPEPDLQAPLRGIILGDSYMQGLLVGDAQTPGECLKRYLAEHEKTRTEILNTGHLGYSPEQEYYTLREYADQFHPTFVVLSLFANDFGDPFEVLHEGKGDWEEGKYWLREITQFCRT